MKKIIILMTLMVAELIAATCIQAATLETVWTQAPDGDLDFLRADNTHRGGAYNKSNNTVVVVSRATGSGVFILDAVDGTLLRTLNSFDLFGGTFAVNMAGVSDDGVIYVGNLSTSADFPNFKLYRFADDSEETLPEVVYEGDPGAIDEFNTSGQRWGDTMDVRGSGNDTQILLGGRSGTRAAILTTDDEGATFTATEIDVTGINAADIGLGVAFGEGDTFWGTAAGRPIYHIAFDLANGSGSVARTIDGSLIPAGSSNISVSADGKYLAATDINSHTVNLYDISDPEAAPVFQSAATFATSNGNGNGTGALDFGDGVLMALETNNGVAFVEVVEPVEAIAPSIVGNPVGANVFEGTDIQLTVIATGTTPLSYQWFKGEDIIEGATSSSLTLTEATVEQSGSYSVRVTNEAGEATSEPVEVAIRKPVDPNLLQEIWSLSPGDRDYLGTANTERGLAYNPAENHVIVVSRNGGNSINVLDADTGEHLNTMDSDPNFIFGGTFAINMVAAGDDGAIYATNLSLDGTSTAFNLYSWENDSADAFAYNAFTGDPGNGNPERWGDSIDARGAGENTQVIISARSGNAVCIFTTQDGFNFDPNYIPGVTGGLGVAFGEGNTFWTTAAGKSLDLYEFDLETGSATLLVSYDGAIFPSGVSPIDAFPAGGFIAGIDLGGSSLLKLFQWASPDDEPLLLLEKSFPVSNPNGNGVGAVAFSANPRRLFALNTNNGIVAYDLGEFDPNAVAPSITSATIDSEGRIAIALTGAPNATIDIEVSSDLVVWENPVSVTLDGSGNGTFTQTISEGASFFRIAQ